MPRRIIGTANYGLYAILTKKTKKTFLRLVAAIIYDVGTDELAGGLRASGIETRKERLGRYKLTAKVWLTDTVIAVQATTFTGLGDDDDDDDRNTPHDICQFEFEPERGQWRLVQVSGTRLPPPGPMNRAPSAAGVPEASGIVTGSARTAAHLAANVGSILGGMLAATGSYIRRSPPFALAARPDACAKLFISHKRNGIGRGAAEARTPVLHSHLFQIEKIMALWAKTIATAFLRGCNLDQTARTPLDAAIPRELERVIMVQLDRNSKLRTALSKHETSAVFNEFVNMETLDLSPERSRRLLQNLLELGAGEGTATTLRRANRDTWNSLIAQPLVKICTRRINIDEIMPTAPNSIIFINPQFPITSNGPYCPGISSTVATPAPRVRGSADEGTGRGPGHGAAMVREPGNCEFRPL